MKPENDPVGSGRGGEQAKAEAEGERSLPAKCSIALHRQNSYSQNTSVELR